MVLCISILQNIERVMWHVTLATNLDYHSPFIMSAAIAQASRAAATYYRPGYNTQAGYRAGPNITDDYEREEHCTSIKDIESTDQCR